MIICKLSKAREAYRAASAAASAAVHPPMRLTVDQAEKLFSDMLALKVAAHKNLIRALQTATIEETCEHLDFLMFGEIKKTK